MRGRRYRVVVCDFRCGARDVSRARKPSIIPQKTLATAEPPVWGTVVYSFPLSILASRDDYLPWFYSNFIQLCVPDPPPEISFYEPWLTSIEDLLPCPLLKVATLDQELATNLCRSDIVGFLIERGSRSIIPQKTLATAEPPVWGTVVYSFPLSILASRDDYLPWFYSNFIQLCVPDPPPEISFYEPWLTSIEDLLPCPLLKVATLDQELATNLCRSDIVGFLIDCLQAGYCVKLEVDYFYLPPLGGYKQSHHIHPILVFGYDTDEQSIQIRCYDSRGQFAPHRVTFREIRDAHAISPEAKRPTILYKYHKPAEPKFHFSFDPDLVVQFMSDYVNSEDSTVRFRVIKDYGNVWGIGVYDWLTEQISDLSRRSELGLSDNLINSFRILWEHKKCMVARIQYMCKHGYLPEENASCDVFTEIERQTNQVRLVMLRWSFKRQLGTLERVMLWIREIEALEYGVLGATLNQIRSPSSVPRRKR